MNDFDILLEKATKGSEDYKVIGIIYAYWLCQRSNSNPSYSQAFKYFKILDTLLIIFGPDKNIIDIIENSSNLKDIVAKEYYTSKNEFPIVDFNEKELLKKDQILILSDPNLTLFRNNMNKPILIFDFVSNWPALTKWKSPNFWINLAGHRFFPVELGDNYMSKEWNQDIIQLNEYFDTYVFESAPKNIAYIAQHNWLNQIPSLSHDFTVPDLCDIFINPKYSFPLVHMWFGMKNTFSPLHFDNYNNIFVQVTGFKYALLVDPIYSCFVSNCFDKNTSSIESQKLFDIFKLHKISYHELILKPGDSLYIPKRWWHQIKSLSFSISISFWF